MIESRTIFFKDMPLFQRASFDSDYIMQGDLEEFACFFYLSMGEMTSFDARGRHHTSSKNAIIKNCGKYIQKFSLDKESHVCEAIAVYLYPELLKEIYKDEIPSFFLIKENQAPKKLIGNELVEQYMNNLSIYFEEPEALDEELGILKLKELMLILLKSENHLGIRELLSEVFAPVNVELQKVVENNLYNNLGIEQLAYLCNMSLSTFKREFKKTFSETPARYIKQKRLARAEQLLITTQESITQIAFAVGFVDVSTFSDNFHKRYKLSPSKYRLNHKTDTMNPLGK